MKRRIRGQETSGIGLVFPGKVCPPEEDKARQEYVLESDIKYQIQRFGVGRPSVSGEVDFDNLDLTRAFALVEEAQQEWLKLPGEVRGRYGSWAGVERAAASGELEQFMKTRGGGTKVTLPGVSASDSAPAEGEKA